MAPTDQPTPTSTSSGAVSTAPASPTTINGLAPTTSDNSSDSGVVTPDPTPSATVPPVAESKVEELKEEVEETVHSLLGARGKVLAEHGGIESNIGLGHDYWEMGNRLRALLNKVK